MVERFVKSKFCDRFVEGVMIVCIVVAIKSYPDIKPVPVPDPEWKLFDNCEQVMTVEGPIVTLTFQCK